MSMTAFDLEQDILKCWNVTTDLGEILDDVEAGQMEIHEAVQALRAYQQVYELRFEKCFRRFEQFNREVWELRQSQVSVEDLGESKKAPKNRGKMGKSKGQKEVDH
jgi:hypothetical protein